MTRRSKSRPSLRRIATITLAGAALLACAAPSPAEAHRTAKVHVVKQHPVKHRHTTRVSYRVGPLRITVPVERDHCHRKVCKVRHAAFVLNRDHVLCRRSGGHFVSNEFGVHVHLQP